VIAAGWRGGTLVATGMLDLALAENQPHAAEVQKVMVHPSARRSGLASRILSALEAAAIAAGRSMLLLDTRAGDAGHALYRAAGWTEYGRVPRHAVDASGNRIETAFFYKEVG
jgi:GNAT superfamily N-acetyltransferase